MTVQHAATGDAFDAGRGIFDALRNAASAHITAAAFANDQLACGMLMEAQDRGVAVPGELALLGFGDFPLGRQMRPALSTVRPPRAEIGRAAAAAVLRSMATQEGAQSSALPWALISRQSTDVWR